MPMMAFMGVRISWLMLLRNVISGVFFDGFPARILNAVAEDRLETFVSADIVDEYQMIVEGFKGRSTGHFHEELFLKFLKAAHVIKPDQTVAICRDPDEDKFLACALSARALYIVSGDKDLLVLERYKAVEIVTAKAFCERYL